MMIRKIVLTLMGCAVVAAALTSCLYVAGCLYFLLNKAVPRHIDWGTWWMYWSAYGNHPLQRTRLLVSLALPLIVVIVAALFALRPTPRSLHGDARWADREDIREARLL